MHARAHACIECMHTFCVVDFRVNTWIARMRLRVRLFHYITRSHARSTATLQWDTGWKCASTSLYLGMCSCCQSRSAGRLADWIGARAPVVHCAFALVALSYAVHIALGWRCVTERLHSVARSSDRRIRKRRRRRMLQKMCASVSAFTCSSIHFLLTCWCPLCASKRFLLLVRMLLLHVTAHQLVM